MENIKNYTFLVRAFAEAIKKSYTEAFNEENNNIEGFASWVYQYNRFGLAFHSSSGLGFGAINIFMPHVACILYANNMVFWCPDEQRNIDAIEVQETFREAYFDGYKKGLKYFNEKYKPFLYTHSEGLFNNLKNLYLTDGAKNGSCGWNYVKEQVPIQFDLGYLEEVGYYSALVSCVDDLSEEYKIVSNLNEATETPPLPPPISTIKFKNLFKDESNAPIILEKIREFLSDTGEWIIKPKGLYLVALCTVLEERGYFLNSFTNPQKAQAFNNQFGTNLTNKIFQQNERMKADYLKEQFNLITSLKNN
jgi:hypothetical protein